jgi:hypothetical protein
MGTKFAIATGGYPATRPRRRFGITKTAALATALLPGAAMNV